METFIFLFFLIISLLSLLNLILLFIFFNKTHYRKYKNIFYWLFTNRDQKRIKVFFDNSLYRLFFTYFGLWLLIPVPTFLISLLVFNIDFYNPFTYVWIVMFSLALIAFAVGVILF